MTQPKNTMIRELLRKVIARMRPVYPWVDGFFGTRRLALLAVFALLTFGAETIVLPMPAAHADDQSYLQYLNDHGTRVMAFNDATRVAYGYQACGMLRNGMSLDAIAGASPVSDGRGIAEAAQHELCPDTLHR